MTSGRRLAEDLVGRVLDIPAPQSAKVPCGSCRRCCQTNSIVMLLPQHGDVVESYEHELVDLPGAGRGPILKRRPNGDCIYLGQHGCTIHDRAPVICRVFDCRTAFLAFNEHAPSDRRRMIKGGMVEKQILDRGRELLEENDARPSER
jgi:Fe-S-cluster containining protein